MTSCAECNSHIIDKQSFSCYAESPNHVTFRARLEGTSERDSGSLLSLIEKWVSDGARINVTGVLMMVDPTCSVGISSLSEGECLPHPTVSPTTVAVNPRRVTSTTVAVNPRRVTSTTVAVNPKRVTITTDPPSTMNPAPSIEVMDTSTDHSSSSPDNTPAIIGAVAIVAILIIAITVAVIAIAALKYRHRNVSLKHAQK